MEQLTKTEKGTVKQKEKVETKELLLYQWVRIVKEIFPRTRTENPYQNELKAITKKLGVTETLLLEDLIHTITLTNKNSRENEKGELLTTREDLLNAVQLVIPKNKRMTSKNVETLAQLKAVFQDEPFTWLQAIIALKTSRSTVKRNLVPLLTNGYIIKLEEKHRKKRLLQIAEPEALLQEKEEEENMFLEAMGDWSEFQGFIDLQYRT
jgi:hypothetical protein